ncbi:hypothetical protein GOBAR_AA02528 [Gossypium barbadense]|uniref:Protein DETOXIFICATION n=1 Tax=Gossypium barbadense TaxID=3634 RepID=A0A2P5YR34_GOSBA|nr:hypothetical protein GOBAR_AA02528 [Gossypium barbadense]
MDENLELRFIAEREEEEEKNDLKKRVWVETKKIWRIAFPSMLARVTSFGMIIVTQSFLGHIGRAELATFALIQSIFVRFINGILIGMSSATETLCGQAFGAEQYHMMGIYLQRSWIVDGLMATVSVPLLVFASPIFKLLGQEEEIAEAAGSISLWFIPMLYQMVFQLTMQMYLQAQLKNFIVGWLSAFSFSLHLLLSWVMVYKLNWGVAGAMGSLNICCWIMVVGEFVFIFGGWCPNTWKGFSKAAWFDLWPIIKLSMASGLMICLELWYTAILVLLAGYMKNATIAIGAFSICDEQVAQVISSLSDLLALSVLFNSFQAILTGVAIGAGFQSMVAIVNLGCYYIVGLPIGVVLGYVLNLQVTGLWIGLLSGVAFQIVILGFIVWRINWDEQVEKASQRLNRWLINEENKEEHNNQIQCLS